MKFKVFVSYSSHDLDKVELLRQQLESSSLEVFIAEHSISAGQELGPVIDKEIKECDMFVVLWSHDARDSDWVSQEIGKATAYKKEILPLLLNENITVPGFINHLKYLPIFHNHEDGLNQATEIMVAAYNKKLHAEKALIEATRLQKEKNTEKWILGAIGAFFFWIALQE